MARGPLHEDAGVLAEAPVCEFQGFTAAALCGGHAVLPWRGVFLEALAERVSVSADASALASGSFGQCLVHLQKSRGATWRDLGEAWRLLADGGRLLIAGSNTLGVVSAVKRLAGELAQTPRILTNRAHARIALFEKRAGVGPGHAEAGTVTLPLPGGEELPLHVEPGAFSARRLDAGTALLRDTLSTQSAPAVLADVGCGVGPLAIAALLLWPDARALLLDGDDRAISSARANLAAAGVADRASLRWWDASEPCPAGGCDLALVNPPFHAGKAVDLAPARAMFRSLTDLLRPDGVALVVANRTLPYEADLAGLGPVTSLREARGYKILRVERSPGRPAARHRSRPPSRP